MNSTKYSDNLLSSLKYTELLKLCKENKLKARGQKCDLIETLKSIPAFIEEDDDCTQEIIDVAFIEEDDDCTQEIIDVDQEDERPVFRDISIITVNSPAKKRCIGAHTSVRDAPIQIEQMRKSEQKLDVAKVTDQDILQTTLSDVKEKERDLQSLLERFQEPAKLIINVIEKKKAELEKAKCTADNYLQEILEQKVSKKELQLSRNYEKERKSLTSGFLSQLQQKENLLLVKEKQVKKMKTELCEQNKLKLTVVELKTELVNKENELLVQTGLMECIKDEFICVICQELFISAVTLPCSHSFCEMCLMTWFKTKKSCPVCRHDVKQKALYSVVLDSAVEKMVENMDAESKHRRTNLLRERNEAKRRTDAAEDPQGIKKMIYRIGEESNSDNTASNTAGLATQTVVNNRRRSRSQSPSRFVGNRPLASNNNNNNFINNIRTLFNIR